LAWLPLPTPDPSGGTCDLDDQGNVNPLMAEWELQNGTFTVLRTFSP
jgi:hypothetical protein